MSEENTTTAVPEETQQEDQVQDQAWDQPQETVEEEKPAAKKESKQPESVYTIKELKTNAKKVFSTMPECAEAALKMAGKTEYTVSEATKIIKEFMNKGVK